MQNRARHSTARSRVTEGWIFKGRTFRDLARRQLEQPPISAIAGPVNWPSYRCAMLYLPVGLFSATHRVQVPDEVGLPGRARSWRRPKVFPEEFPFV
jgi:hypothetical protein